MTRKHFIALADHIRTVNHADGQTQAKFDRRMIDELANFCAEQNSRFNRSRWLAYIKGECGPNGGKVQGSSTKRPSPKPKEGETYDE